MNAFNFGSHHAHGMLHAYRALLLPVFTPGTSYCVMNGFTFCFFVTTLVSFSVDASRYNAMPHGAPWVGYGPNLAELLFFGYLVARVVYSRAPPLAYDAGVVPPDEISTAGRVTWALHTLAVPAVTTGLIVYEAQMKALEPYRESQEGSYIAVFVVMILNLLISNTPLLLEHGVAWLVVLNVYLILLLIYAMVADEHVYPTDNVEHILFIEAVGVLSYLGAVVVLKVREFVLARCGVASMDLWYVESQV